LLIRPLHDIVKVFRDFLEIPLRHTARWKLLLSIFFTFLNVEVLAVWTIHAETIGILHANLTILILIVVVRVLLPLLIVVAIHI
jgi:hypothetical protein